MTRIRTRVGALALVAATAVILTACGGGEDPLAKDSGGGGGTAAPAGTVTVGSADFSESKLLAHLYTGALRAKGVQVNEPRLGIGAREVYLKGLDDGSINVIPEYTGALALHYDKSFAGTDPNEVYSHLEKSLPGNLAVLKPSAAEDKDCIAVTRETAQSKSLRTVGDLAKVSNEMTLGAPSEFKNRPQGVPGLEKTYGIRFEEVRALGGQALVQALTNGQVDAANVFTTDPAFTQHDLVPLEDDKGLFGSQNVVPLITKEVQGNTKAVEALDALSTSLTTKDLQTMLTKVDVEHADPAQVAEEYLDGHPLD
ncbi:ABC transporter substrate-binding protein [Mobilicoccus pelagius]|uniref:Putative ABC transporter substrate-binding protein n=1 Tax=Mobilicoccus pelagius NBRC 104925 TaxID=1089455 RepID=H5UW47_9MICO|nr:ABC transporter substrate-binding protein [Mobilicoccus pelagius]GAB49955.1 putative ABC transporter substrate-binding protein [Mobilicoccus pelagius NBRC 104925]